MDKEVNKDEYLVDNGKCYVGIHLENKNSSLSGYDFSIIIRDSIFDLFPTCKLSIKDSSFRLNEYRAFVNGTPLQVFLDTSDNKWVGLPLVVDENSTPQQLKQGEVGGNIELRCVHEFWYKQEKLKQSFNDNISNIIRKIANKYKFKSIDIDDTTNKGLWLQPSMTDSEFIIDNLLPFCYSVASQDSPFYCFIDSDNIFHLKSLFKMTMQKPVMELTYSNNNMNDENAILSISPLQTSAKILKDDYVRNFNTFDKNGNYQPTKESVYLINYPKRENKVMYRADMKLLSKDLLTYVDSDFINEEDENNEKGYEINSIRNKVYMDKIIITLNLNRKLKSGQVVKINIPIKNKDGQESSSISYNGTYLIESSIHRWDNVSKFASTTLVCSKQSTNLNMSYLNKEKMAKV